MYNPIHLSNGIKMPPLVQTTNWQTYEQMSLLVQEGLRVGFRAFDTARDYGNEPIVGRVLEESLKEFGMKRENIFITTKIGNSQQRKGDIAGEIEQSLDNLHTDYVDLWLMHWPYLGYYIDTWRKMEKVYASGKVRAIGIANCSIRHFNALFSANIETLPHCVQFEHHPLRTADELLEFCKQKNIAIQAYSPLCRMIPKICDNPLLCKIANKVGKTVPQVILRWHFQHQSVPVFKTLKLHRLKENFNIWDFELNSEDMKAVFALNEDYKFHLESASCPAY